MKKNLKFKLILDFGCKKLKLKDNINMICAVWLLEIGLIKRWGNPIKYKKASKLNFKIGKTD